MVKSRNILTLLFFSILIFPAAAENYLAADFNDYGIQTIGIYTESYPDTRSDNFVFEVAALRSNGILMDVDFFRYRYSNYDLVTPPLTTLSYPLDGAAAGKEVPVLNMRVQEYLEAAGWSAQLIEDFSGGTVEHLLGSAKEDGLDAVLIIRYTPIIYLVPVENYAPGRSGRKAAADIGKIKKGMALIPAVELYDTASGTRLWYSAYHTGHQIITKRKSYEDAAASADAFFAHTDKGAAEAAAGRMVELTLNSTAAPFPKPAGTERLEGAGSNPAIRHLFWTNYPSYAFYGNAWGIGYSLDFIGDYPILYKDNISDASPIEAAGTLPNAVMHRISMPFLSIGTGNIMLDPSLYFGFSLPAYANIVYDDIGKYGSISYNTADTASASFTSLGLKLSLKYSLRFTDHFSAYIGGSASAGFWWQLIQGYETTSDNFTTGYGGLYTDYDMNLIANASVLAGVRFDRKIPFEIFAEYTPTGPSGGAMISAGARLIPFTYGFIDPHARSIAGRTRGY